jgi:hypothetical protein
MRLHNSLSILATAASLAAISVPVAHAEAIGDDGGGGTLTNQHIAAGSQRASSTDWTVIALASGGAVVLIGAGVGGSRGLNRRHGPADQARAARGA